MAGIFDSGSMIKDMENQPDYVQRTRQRQHDWYIKNQERLKEKARQHYWANRDAIRANYQRKSPIRAVNYQSQKSPEHRHRYYSEVLAERHLRLKMQVLQIVSEMARPECQFCSATDIRVLTINHINGNGTLELRGRLGVAGFRQSILDGKRTTDDLNVLCFSCNILYEYQRGRRRMPRNWEAVLMEEEANFAGDIR